MRERQLHALAETIAAWSASHPEVRACFWLGSFCRGSLHDGSDLDVALVLDASLDGARVYAELLRTLRAGPESIEWSAHLSSDRRIVVWLGPHLVRLDVHYAHDASELSWLADAFDVAAPRMIAAWAPRDPALEALVTRAAADIDRQDGNLRRLRAEDEIDKLVVAFQACAAAQMRGDPYVAYFQHNLALGRLVRVLQVTRASYDHLYLPRDVLAGMSESEKLQVQALAASLRPAEATTVLERLADRFVDAVSEARAALGVEREPELLRQLLVQVLVNLHAQPSRAAGERWRHASVSRDRTHHVVNDTPLYAARFDEVMSFHEPGLAPVRRGGAAWHIRDDGFEAYSQRFRRTFGYYEGLASVESLDGWHHIRPDGSAVGSARFAWCGNYQQARCAVRDRDGGYLHLDRDGNAAYSDRWRYVGDFREGFAVAQADDGRSTHIDCDGELLHGRWFRDLDVFHKGAARARDEGGWTHVDHAGRPLYERRFAMVEPFYNGRARVERFDGGLEVVDRAGRMIELLRQGPPETQG